MGIHGLPYLYSLRKVIWELFEHYRVCVSVKMAPSPFGYGAIHVYFVEGFEPLIGMQPTFMRCC